MAFVASAAASAAVLRQQAPRTPRGLAATTISAAAVPPARVRCRSIGRRYVGVISVFSFLLLALTLPFASADSAAQSAAASPAAGAGGSERPTAALPTAGADGAARLAAAGARAPAEAQAPPAPFRLRLQRHAARGSSRRWSYVGRVDLGAPVPQPLLVSLDTASGNLIVPSWGCKSRACLEHRRYCDAASDSAVAIDVEGKRAPSRFDSRDTAEIGISTLDFGDGRVHGELVQEAVCLGKVMNASAATSTADPACVRLGIISSRLPEVPFGAMPQDGILGLGRGSLAVGKTFGFLAHLGFSGMQAQFSLYFSKQWGEATFGEHQASRLASGPRGEAGTLAWVPVPEEHRADGYWEVRIRSIRVGNRTLDLCPSTGCRGIVDSGSTRLGIHESRLASLREALGLGKTAAALAVPGGDADSEARALSACNVPDLSFELAGAGGVTVTTLTLTSEDISGASGCDDGLTPLQLPEEFGDVLILGEPLLRRYYTVFSWEPVPQIGFGLAAAPSEAEETLANAEALVASEALARDGSVAAAAAAAAAAAQEAEKAAVLARDSAEILEETLTGGEPSAFARLNFLAHVCLLQILLTALLAAPQAFRIARALLAGRPLDEAMHLARLSSVKAPPEGIECAICLGSCEEDLKTSSATAATCCEEASWSKLRCGHSFHERCIIQWLQRAGSCPVCRGQA
eukprot:TRINITY_DN38331_c0_g1_i1.p1 TRINITY_DN38331_c0_g1~~TRINITY_DN38331_c0_g1_i1.p1  ORF type:complete len:690 (-),score=156.08 TRINITY_DN38331_c0_g1_i1:39-2108(-)